MDKRQVSSLWDFFHKRKQKVLASLTSKLFEECQPYGILFWIDCAHTPAMCTIHLKNIFSLSPFPFTIIMLFYSSQAYSAQTSYPNRHQRHKVYVGICGVYIATVSGCLVTALCGCQKQLKWV